VGNAAGVLDGDLEEFVEAFLRWQLTARSASGSGAAGRKGKGK
jgi:hypothetical protein